MVIQHSRLGPLTKIGDGGQGDVFAAGDHVGRLVGYAEPVAVKAYHANRVPPAGAALALVQRTEWARSLDDPARSELFSIAAWPLAVVLRGQTPWGLVMPDMRARFCARIDLPSGGRAEVLVSLEHLLNDDGYLLRRFGVVFSTAARARAACSIAHGLAILHRHGIVASDISQTNVLVTLRTPFASAFIDCDSMVFRGRGVLHVVETPGWCIPTAFGEEPTTRSADSYKLALAILRLFCRSQTAASLRGPLPGTGAPTAAAFVPSVLHDALELALRGPIRPTATVFQSLLEQAPATALDLLPVPPTAAQRAAGARRAAAPQAGPSPPAPAAAQRSPATRSRWWRLLALVPAIVILALVVVAGSRSGESAERSGAETAAVDARAAPPYPARPEPFGSAADDAPAPDYGADLRDRYRSLGVDLDPSSSADRPKIRTSTSDVYEELLRGELLARSIPDWPEPADPPGRALREYYELMTQDEGLYTDPTREARDGWTGWAISAPLIRVVAIGRARRHGSSARVPIRFYFHLPDEPWCRRVARDERLVLLHGRWRVDSRQPPEGRLVSFEHCLR